MINYSGTFNIPLDWMGWYCLALPIAVILLFVLTRSRNRAELETRSGLKLDSDLQEEIARSKARGFTSSWVAPRVPAGIIASIWTHRFFAGTTREFAETRRYRSSLMAMTWNFNRAAPIIIAAAFMSLRDAGLIRMSIDSREGVLDSFRRVRIEPTDLARSSSELPAIDGGLLYTSLAFSEKRFAKSTRPAASHVVRDWIHKTQNNPSRWVVQVAINVGRELGLYEPVVDERSGFRKLFGGGPKPVYSIPHLAACEDQAEACLSRWREFGDSEPELQQRLITEVAFGIYARQARG